MFSCLKRPTQIGLAVLGVVAAGSLTPARAQYPEQNITVVVGYNAGGFTDTVARIFVDRLQRVVGRTMIVENRVGAGGRIGADYVTRARPDGYTLLFHGVGTAAAAAGIDPRPGDGPEALAYAARVGAMPTVMTATPDVKDFKTMIEKVKANPGKLSYASAGVGVPGHLLSEVIIKLFALDIQHVPYRGGQQALIDVGAGLALWMIDTPVSSGPLIEQKRVVPMAVIAPQRIKPMPDVPTLRELGYPQFGDAMADTYLLAPRATPRPILERLNSAAQQVRLDPEFIKRLEDFGFVLPPPGMGLDQTEAAAREDWKVWFDMAKSTGAKNN